MQFSTLQIHQESKNWLINTVNNKRLPHALLLRGEDGIGKLALCNAIAQYLNCLDKSPTDSCGKCSSCHKIQKGIHPDIQYIFPYFIKTENNKPLTTLDYIEDFRKHFFENPYITLNDWQEAIEAENKNLIIPIDEVRNIRKNLNLTAYESQYRIIILWHIEKLNVNATNAFLKLLEEPPEDTIILATTNPTATLLPTINSRCQTLNFKPLNTEQIKSYLITNNSITETQANDISHLAEGSIGKALQLMKNIQEGLSTNYQNWMRICWQGIPENITNWTQENSKLPKENLRNFFQFILYKLRDAILLKYDSATLVLSNETEVDFLKKFTNTLSTNALEQITHLIELSLFHLSRNANPQLLLHALTLNINSIMQVSK